MSMPVSLPASSEALAPQLVSMRTLAAEGSASFDWHSHPFEEFTLVTDDDCLIGYPPGWRDTAPNTLLYYHTGEKHGAWSSPQQRPHFWVVHFRAGPGVHAALPRLAEPEPARRAWALTPEQVGAFQSIFLQLLSEHSGNRPHRELAASACLQQLLVAVDRWAASRGDVAPVPIPSRAGSDVLRLWHLVNAAVRKPNEELKEIYSAPNYDSVRHAFRKTFGCSPREMLQRLRLEHAKTLLLESRLSIKEVALQVGYASQNDFNRLFHRHAGLAPSKWRMNPMPRKPDG